MEELVALIQGVPEKKWHYLSVRLWRFMHSVNSGFVGCSLKKILVERNRSQQDIANVPLYAKNYLVSKFCFSGTNHWR